MIQTDFFETLLKRVRQRPQRRGAAPRIAKEASEFEFNGYKVSIMRRPYQRSIGVIIKPTGLIRVTASRSTSARSIWQFLKECEAWIEKTQKEYSELRKKYPPKTMNAGEKFLYLGQPHELIYSQGHCKGHKVVVGDKRIHFFIGTGDSPSEDINLKRHLIKFYEKEARQVLKDRVEHFSLTMNLYPKKLSFRAQKTRWGSCGANGHVSLNCKLIAAPLDVLDYVVIHELAHLKYQNHSQMFWNLVEQYSPKYKSHRKWLLKNQYEFDFLSKKSELNA